MNGVLTLDPATGRWKEGKPVRGARNLSPWKPATRHEKKLTADSAFA